MSATGVVDLSERNTTIAVKKGKNDGLLSMKTVKLTYTKAVLKKSLKLGR